MRITRLELKNVGVFEHQVIDFQSKTDPDKAEIHILTGVNGSGKSTILYALASAFVLSPLIQKRFRYNDERSLVTTTCINGSENPFSLTVSYVNRQRIRYSRWTNIASLS